MRVLLDLSQLFFAARANKVVLNYGALLRRLQGPGRVGQATGFTTASQQNQRQLRFIELLRDLNVEVVVDLIRDNPNFTIELAMLAVRSTDLGGLTYVSGDPLLQRTLPFLTMPVTVAFFPSHIDPSWNTPILSGRVGFVDLSRPPGAP